MITGLLIYHETTNIFYPILMYVNHLTNDWTVGKVKNFRNFLENYYDNYAVHEEDGSDYSDLYHDSQGF